MPSKKTMSEFFVIWTGGAISLLGSQLVQFALIWYLTEQTGSATMLAMASLVGLLPQVVLGPLAGALVDRWNRRLVMIAADGSIALVTVGLAIIFALGLIQPWHILLLMFIRSLGGAFHWPALQASISLMVPDEHLTRIAGLNQMLHGGLNIISAPLGALLLAIMPVQSILLIDVGTALIAILPLTLIAIPQPERRSDAGEKPATFINDLMGGFRYVWAWKGMVVLLAFASLLNMIIAPAFSLMPLLVTGHFSGGAPQLAALQTAFGIGTIAGGLALGAWGGFKRRIFTSLFGLIGLAAGMVTLGLVPPSLFTVAVGGLLFSGLMMPMVNGPIMAIVQSAVAPDIQGRVFTLLGSLSAAAAPLGLVIAGPLADAVGLQPVYLVSGAVCLGMGTLGFLMPIIRDIENNPNGVPAAEGAPADAAIVEEPSQV